MIRYGLTIIAVLLFVDAKGQDVSSSRNMSDSVKRIFFPVASVKVGHGRIASSTNFETEKIGVTVVAKDSAAKFKKRKGPDHASWRLGINAGYELCLAPAPYDLPKDLGKYKKGLRYGSFVGADAVKFFNRNVGAGVKYSLFKTGNKAEMTYTLNDGTTFDGRISDDIYVHYIGPFLSLRSIPKKNKVYANCDFSIGYVMYYNNNALGEKHYTLVGNNFGFASSFGADFMVSNEMSLGLNLSITAASVTTAKSEEHMAVLNGEQTENLSRISLGLIIRYYR